MWVAIELDLDRDASVVRIEPKLPQCGEGNESASFLKFVCVISFAFTGSHVALCYMFGMSLHAISDLFFGENHVGGTAGKLEVIQIEGKAREMHVTARECILTGYATSHSGR